MKMRLAILGAWLLRLAGWSILVFGFSFLIANRKGIALRAQFDRLSVFTEWDATIQWLSTQEALAGLEGVDITPDVFIGSLYTGLFEHFIPSYMVAAFVQADQERAWLTIYDPDGHLVGSPMPYDPIWGVTGSHRLPNVGPNPRLVVLPFDLVRSLNIPALRTQLYRILQIHDDRIQEVLRIETNVSARQLTFASVQRSEDRVTVKLWLCSSAVPNKVPTKSVLARFEWDLSAAAFIIPEPDPQGRWKIVEPTP